MLHNAHGGLRRRAGAGLASVLLMALAILLWMVSFALKETAAASLPEARLTVAIPNSLSDPERVHGVIGHIQTAVSLVTDVDTRVAAKAYTSDGVPYIPSAAPELASDANICIVTVKINGIRSADRWEGSFRTRYVHDYDMEIVRIHELHECYADIGVGSRICMQLRTPVPEEEWAEQGKSYLVWGRLQQTERDGKPIYQLVPIETGQRKVVREEGRHLVYVQKTGEHIPVASELSGSMEELLKTEIGGAWQERILPIANVLYFSLDVVGTDIPDSIRAFRMEETVVTDGTMLTAAQCRNGDRVCVVSEQLAQSNGWSVGESICLCMYDGTSHPTVYHTGSGFFFEADYRIVGIYRNVREYTGEGVGVHPNTVCVPLSSIENCSIPSTDVSLVIESGKENLFEAEMQKLGYAGLFSYYRGPETEDAVTRLAVEEARERWIGEAARAARHLRLLSVLMIVLTVFGWMRGCGREIGSRYRIETAEGILFSHILLQILTIGLLSAALSAVAALWCLPLSVSYLLRRLAEPDFADALTEALPALPFAWHAWLSCMGVILLCGVVSAAVGMKRKYHYSYREGGEP